MIAHKDVPNWEGYRTGTDGSVWSCRLRCGTRGLGKKWRKLKTCFHKRHNRYYVCLYNQKGERKAVEVHLLVMTTFNGHPPPGMECCHNNGDSTDNRLDNLRWDTRKGNMADTLIHGTKNRGERNGIAKLIPDRIREIRKRISLGESQKSIASSIGVAQSLISLINTRKIWSHVD